MTNGNDELTANFVASSAYSFSRFNAVRGWFACYVTMRMVFHDL